MLIKLQLIGRASTRAPNLQYMTVFLNSIYKVNILRSKYSLTNYWKMGTTFKDYENILNLLMIIYFFKHNCFT